jgi:hypothetical protein
MRPNSRSVASTRFSKLAALEDVAGDCERAASAAPHALRGSIDLLARARGHHHVGARLRVGLGDRRADAAARAGDDGHTVVESEAFEYSHGSSEIAGGGC